MNLNESLIALRSWSEHFCTLTHNVLKNIIMLIIITIMLHFCAVYNYKYFNYLCLYFFFPANPSWTEVWDTDFFRNFVGFFPCFFHWGFKKKSLICKIIDFPHIIQTYDLFKLFSQRIYFDKTCYFWGQWVCVTQVFSRDI